MPITTVASHKGKARPILRDSCVVGVKVYGMSPSMFKEIKNSIKEVSIAAHLCPGTLMGRKSSRVNRFRNQFCRVKRRLLVHRFVGVGNRSQGKERARASRGMYRNVGDINWSNRLSVIVRLRRGFYVFLYLLQ